MIMNVKQKKIKIEPRIKLNYNGYMWLFSSMTVVMTVCVSASLYFLLCHFMRKFLLLHDHE